MSYQRYPEIPQISSTQDGIEISYQGIKLYLARNPGNAKNAVRLSKLERELSGAVTEEEVDFVRTERKFLDHANLLMPTTRARLIRMVRKRADWLTDEDVQRLDEIIAKYLGPETEQKRPIQSHRGMPWEAYQREQRRIFCEVWSYAFSRNIHEEEAARRLGYSKFFK
ncbi:hypothetical protein KY359_00525 [Candidatus Woesearchaeota archaeon]|nr:hypothetical protein [Candidatus Woesearchaeota archaeon]